MPPCSRERSVRRPAVSNTILQATPLVLGGLAVGIGFKAGCSISAGWASSCSARSAPPGWVPLGAAPAAHRDPGGACGRDGGGRRLGLDPRRPQGPVGCPRGRHDDHAQLRSRPRHRVTSSPGHLLGPGLLVRPDRRYRQQRAPDHPRHQLLARRSSWPFAAVPVVWWLLYRTTLGSRSAASGRIPVRRDMPGCGPSS